MYDYRQAITADILEVIHDEFSYEDICEALKDRECFAEQLNCLLWCSDRVTGNASGSYTFNRWQAKKYVVDGMDELTEALYEFGTSSETIAEKFLDESWEYFDVTIRCYLLGECIAAALEELEDEFNEAHEDEEDEEE